MYFDSCLKHFIFSPFSKYNIFLFVRNILYIMFLYSILHILLLAQDMIYFLPHTKYYIFMFLHKKNNSNFQIYIQYFCFCTYYICLFLYKMSYFSVYYYSFIKYYIFLFLHEEFEYFCLGTKYHYFDA